MSRRRAVNMHFLISNELNCGIQIHFVYSDK